MANQHQIVIVLIAIFGEFLCRTVLCATKEDTLKDAAQTQAELHKSIEKLAAKGFKALTDPLTEIDHSISSVIAQLTAETDPHNITVLEMEYLRSKTKLSYEQMAVDNDVRLAEDLSKKADVLLDQIKLDIKSLEAQNMSEQAEVLRIDQQQLELFAAILKKEVTREPLRYIETLIGNVERSIERKLNSVEQDLKRLTTKSHGSFYSNVPFAEELNIVLKNLRAEGNVKLANEIEKIFEYVIDLEKIKTSGVYNGTEMEKTLDDSIQMNQSRLVSLVNQLLN